MFQIDNPATLARKYKGAPLACLWVLIFTKQRVSQSFLQSMTGYTDKTISSALQYLKEDGLIEHSNYGWMLASDVTQQLPLTFQLEEGRRNSDPIISSINSINLIDELTTNTKSRKNSEVWDLLESVGVYHNQVTDTLAAKLSTHDVRLAIRQLSIENKPLPANAGLLISRLKNPIKLKSDEDTERENINRYGEWEK
jgi:predicted transcriptional regulator